MIEMQSNPFLGHPIVTQIPQKTRQKPEPPWLNRLNQHRFISRF